LQGKAISITYSECVFVDLGTQHAIRMRYIVICGLYSIFPHYLISGTVFEKTIEHKMCLLSLQLLSATFRILRTNRDMIKNLYWSSCIVPDILVRV